MKVRTITQRELRSFVPRAVIADAAGRAARIDAAQFRADLDAVASTAEANDFPLYTRNPSDFSALKRIVKVVKV